MREDLRQEVMIALLEKDEQFIVDVHARKELAFYTVRVILNLAKSNTSPFYKKYRLMHQEFIEGIKPDLAVMPEDIADREVQEAIEDFTIEQINSLYWYDQELVRLYMKLGNFRALEKDTGIPFISCYKNVKKSIALLKSKVTGENKPLFNKEERAFIQK